MHRSIQSALRRTHPLPRAKIAMIRVAHESGDIVGIFERDFWLAHNRDAVSDAEAANIRAGRETRVTSQAGRVFVIAPVEA